MPNERSIRENMLRAGLLEVKHTNHTQASQTQQHTSQFYSTDNTWKEQRETNNFRLESRIASSRSRRAGEPCVLLGLLLVRE